MVLFLAIGCKQEIKPEDISKINGYWEIEKVVFPSGEDKDYKVNQTIDYFQISGKTGIRKKVMPQLDGKYLENGKAENIEVVFADEKAYLHYNSGFAKWKEEIVKITNDQLVFKNASNKEYHYKRSIPFSIK